MKGNSYAFIMVAFISICVSPAAKATDDSDPSSPNVIPAECKHLVDENRLLIAGPYDSSDIGARLWSLARIEKLVSKGPSEVDCLKRIWDQARNDERVYWKHISKKYTCEDSASAGAHPAQCGSVQINLQTVAVSDRLRELDPANPQTGSCSGGSNVPAAVINAGRSVNHVITHLLAQEQREVSAPSLTPSFENHLFDDLFAKDTSVPVQIQNNANCQLVVQDKNGKIDESKLRSEFQTEEYKKIHPQNSTSLSHYLSPSGILQGIGDLSSEHNVCLHNYLPAFGHGLYDTGKSMVDLTIGVLDAREELRSNALSAVGTVAKAGYAAARQFASTYGQGPQDNLLSSAGLAADSIWRNGFTTAARQFATEEKPTLDKVKAAMPNKIFQALWQKLSNESSSFTCLNTQAKLEKACAIMGYLGPDIVALVPGFGEATLAQLAKIPKMAEALETAKLTIDAAKGLSKAVAVGAFKYIGEGIRLTGALIKKWKRFYDLTNKVTWALVGKDLIVMKPLLNASGKVVLDASGEPVMIGHRVIEPSLYRKMIAKLDEKFGKGNVATVDGTPPQAPVATTGNAPPPIEQPLVTTGEVPPPVPDSVPPPPVPAAVPGFIRRQVNRVTSAANRTWDVASPTNRSVAEVNKRTAQVESVAVKLPPGYGGVEDPILNLNPADLTPEMKARWEAAFEKQAEERARLFKMETTHQPEVVHAPDGSQSLFHGSYQVKDAEGVVRSFVTETGPEGQVLTNSVMRQSAKPASYQVSLYVHPEKIGDVLPEILKRADKGKALGVQLDTSPEALQSGKHFSVWFDDPIDARNFARTSSYYLDLNGLSMKATSLTAKLKSGIQNAVTSAKQSIPAQVTKYVSKAAIVAGITRCHQGGQDAQCNCHAFFDLGIDPEDLAAEELHISRDACASHEQQEIAANAASRILLDSGKYKPAGAADGSPTVSVSPSAVTTSPNSPPSLGSLQAPVSAPGSRGDLINKYE